LFGPLSNNAITFSSSQTARARQSISNTGETSKLLWETKRSMKVLNISSPEKEFGLNGSLNL